MRTGDNPIHNFILPISLYDEGKALSDRCSRIIYAEVVDIVPDLIIGHRHFIAEVVVLVRIHIDRVSSCVP
jgi:hypothetical protein